MNVSLIFVPSPVNIASAESPSVDSQGGMFPPLQLAYIAALIENAGHKVQIIDSIAESLSKETTFNRIKEFKTDLIGMSSGLIQWREILDWADYFKSKKDVPIVVGGPVMTEYSKEALSHKQIDFGIFGYKNETILELLESLKTKKGFEKIEGLCFVKNKKFHTKKFTDKKYDFKNLNRLPWPARHLLKNNKYFEFYTKKKNFTLMLTSTGCPYNCSFCPNKFDKFSARPIENVLDEIEEIYDKHHIREIDFKDNTFTLNKQRVKELCNGLKKRNLHNKIRWSCMTRVDCVDDNLLKTMAQTGCVQVKYGIESGNQRILHYYSKGITPDQIKLAVYLTKKYGMEAYGFFQFGGPGETMETAKETSKFATDLAKGIYEQTGLEEITQPIEVDCYTDYEPKNKKEYDMWKYWVLDPKYVLPARTIGTNMKDEEILSVINKTYKKFYLSPSYIWKKLKRPNVIVLKKGIIASFSILTAGFSNKVISKTKAKFNKIKL